MRQGRRLARRRGRQGQRGRRRLRPAGSRATIGYVEYAYALQNKLTPRPAAEPRREVRGAHPSQSFQAAAAGADWKRGARLLPGAHRPARRRQLADHRRLVRPRSTASSGTPPARSRCSTSSTGASPTATPRPSSLDYVPDARRRGRAGRSRLERRGEVRRHGGLEVTVAGALPMTTRRAHAANRPPPAAAVGGPPVPRPVGGGGRPVPGAGRGDPAWSWCAARPLAGEVRPVLPVDARLEPGDRGVRRAQQDRRHARLHADRDGCWPCRCRLVIALFLVELAPPAVVEAGGRGHRAAGRGAQHHLRHVGPVRVRAVHVRPRAAGFLSERPGIPAPLRRGRRWASACSPRASSWP